MRLPKKAKDLGPWASDIIEKCTASRQKRVTEYRYWRSYFFSGTSDNTQCFYNKTEGHVNRLSGYLYSAPDVRFQIEFDITSEDGYLARATAAQKFLNREFHRRGVDLTFGQALKTALMKDSGFIKVTWGENGLEPWVVQPEFIGVYREDVPGLDRQEAFVHSTFMTPSAFEALIFQREDFKDIMGKIASAAAARREDPNEDDYFRQIVIGGNQPVATQPVSNSPRGSVSVFGAPLPQLSADVSEELIRVDELWVQDDDRQDWTTIRMVDPDIVISGDFKRENLSGVEGETGFVQVCANQVANYFWGRSSIAPVAAMQDMLNQRISDINTLINLRVDNPMAFIGATDITSEKVRALKARAGWITESNPSAKIERLAPDMPPDALEQVNQVISWFDEVGGFQPIMTGQGEQGVRSGQHAGTLVRTASPHLKDQALLVERQLAEVGDFSFKLLQNKDARAFKAEGNQEFTLIQLPEDYRVTVDSHSGSPAFSEDSRNLAFMLAKAGAIDEESLIQLTKPPMEDTLIARARKKREAAAQFAEKHPELIAKQKSKSRR